MISLSVVIITFNEERNILRCIQSVKNIADEIVVVDSFSSDKTHDICKSNGVKFIQHTFEGHIEQKNWAITQASSKFVLSLDADELLTPELEKSILEAKNDWKCDGYYFNRLTNYCGKWIRHGGWYPDRKLRLWDSSKGAWTGINPHDRYEMNKDAKICFLQGDLLHYSYYSISQHLQQVDKFTEIGARAAFEKGRKISLFGMLILPSFKFFKDYIIHAGFLDGYYGYVIARISAHASYIKYLKIRELKRQHFIHKTI
jgi:glycosyltransferase involved in cell wall biosynthesis